VDEKSRCTNTELLKEILCLKIKQNIDGNSPTDSKMSSSKKKLLESLPKDLLEAVQYLNSNVYSKTSSTNYERKCVVECIYFIIHEVPLVFSKTDKKQLIIEVLNLKPKDKSGKNPPDRSELIISNRLVSWLICQIIQEIEKDDQKAMLEIICHHLEEKNLEESDLSILLNGFNTICRSIDCTSAFKSDVEFLEILLPFINSGRLGLQIST
jgi:hypothetical protein